MENQNNRLGIFVFYDKDGIADRYVEYYLEDLCRNLNRLVIVCNGSLTPAAKDKLSCFTKELVLRENKGFDVWGYKAGIDLLGWDEIMSYEELVLCNDTVFGPIFPFSEMFQAMDKRNLDFWGITKHETLMNNPFVENTEEELKEHIQSYFMVFGNSILANPEFQTYWNQLPAFDSYKEAVSQYEARMTSWLSELGYSYDTYVPSEPYHIYTPNPVMMCPDRIVKESRCPIVKRRVFTTDYAIRLYETIGNAPAEVMRFLQENTDFDTDMIWENILRVGDAKTIQDNLHLHFVLDGGDSRDKAFSDEGCGISKDGNFSSEGCWITKDGNFSSEGCVPEKLDISWDDLVAEMTIVCTASQAERLQELLQKHSLTGLPVCVVESVQKLVGASSPLVIGDFQYYCLLPDMDSLDISSASSRKDMAYNLFQNLIQDKAYLYQVARLFRERKWLGVLKPPIVCHGATHGYPLDTCGWYRREVLLENAKGQYAEATIYNSNGLRTYLSNSSFCYARDCSNLTQQLKSVQKEWNKITGAYKELQTSHNQVIGEWSKTVEALKDTQAAHDLAVSEWNKTAEVLKNTQAAHDLAVSEWNKTAEAYKQLEAKYQKTLRYKLSRIFKK